MLKIERIQRSDTAIFFRTTSNGVDYRWCLVWLFEAREFASHASWMETHNFIPDSSGYVRVVTDPRPNWTLPLKSLEPYITDEDRAAFLALSMRRARSAED